MPVRKLVSTRTEKSKILKQILNLNLILGLKTVKGVLHIKSVLKVIELQKKLFVNEIELGQEVFIPQRLSDKSLPKSFMFYDPIVRIIQELVSDERKEFFHSQNLLNYKNFKNNSLKFYLYDKFIGAEASQKQTFKYSVVNKKEEK